MTQPAVTIKIEQLPHGKGLALPAYETAGAAGMDLRAALPEGTPVIIGPMGRSLIPTGIGIELPTGFEAQIRPRSGLALKYGVTVLNSPGTIDCDYRGEIKVILVNLSDCPVEIHRDDRIAQMVVAASAQANITLVDALSLSKRGTAGFGSTGKR
ncbi:MAG: deoxyuridine 5'-triphosphate nucleotidohydrolase [Rhodomicrobium sp.]|nr:MAG: deoxyuridine 5'-triphosphate nucleotidohydrolase [Rhodomicrobium sp.]